MASGFSRKLCPSCKTSKKCKFCGAEIQLKETSYTLILTLVEPPISSTTQETSYTLILTQESIYTPILNQVEPPIPPTTQESIYTPILNQVEPPIPPTTQETSYTPILNQVEPPITPTPRAPQRKSCSPVTLKKPSNLLSMTQSTPSNPIQP
ncbi:unnamed protein product [Coregonus sp. 'balchen']|nr:unnamed protein product [Coregonus sp. 'balchen']